MSLLVLISEALNTKAVELQEFRVAIQQRILKNFSEKNSGLEPTEDRHGRLHAPCDGYEHFETGEMYGKGQFILMPENGEGVEPSNYTPVSYDPKTRIKVDKAIHSEMMKLLESYRLMVTTGRRWMEGDKEYCYFTVTGHGPYIAVIRAVTEQFWASIREEGKHHKGTAPTGKQQVNGKIIRVKQVESNFDKNRIETKMTIELANGATTYGTMPKALIDKGTKLGDTVEFSATFEHAKDDKTHAYFNRPRVK